MKLVFCLFLCSVTKHKTQPEPFVVCAPPNVCFTVFYISREGGWDKVSHRLVVFWPPTPIPPPGVKGKPCYANDRRIADSPFLVKKRDPEWCAFRFFRSCSSHVVCVCVFIHVCFWKVTRSFRSFCIIWRRQFFLSSLVANKRAFESASEDEGEVNR